METNYHNQQYVKYVEHCGFEGAEPVSFEHWLNLRLTEAEAKIEEYRHTINESKGQLSGIEAIIKDEEAFQRCGRGWGSLADQVREAFQWHHRKTEQVIGGAKAFNQDLIVYFRAIALVAGMVGNAGTHREKNARLRGLIEQIESAVQKLRDNDMRFDRDYYWAAPDVWRSDYPVREYIQRNQELERQIAELKGEQQKPYTPSDLYDVGF